MQTPVKTPVVNGKFKGVLPFFDPKVGFSYHLTAIARTYFGTILYFHTPNAQKKSEMHVANVQMTQMFYDQLVNSGQLLPLANNARS